jgi:hypothetical protein
MDVVFVGGGRMNGRFSFLLFFLDGPVPAEPPSPRSRRVDLSSAHQKWSPDCSTAA